LEDNFPTTNIEAIACGTPVITFNTGGSPEIIDQFSGITVEKGDKKGLIDALKIVRINGKNFYSQTCILRAKENFDSSKRFNDYIDLYKSVLINQ